MEFARSPRQPKVVEKEVSMTGSNRHDDENPKTEFEDQFKTEFEDQFKTELGESFTLGDYRLIGEIGRGGMGIVYEAQRQGSSTSVALKTLTRFEPHALHRFKQEFRILADLAHPNLVQLGELVTTQREPFFTMEFIRGVSFRDYVRHSTDSSLILNECDTVRFSFDEARLRESLLQLVDGLRVLHRAGSLHRDLKPSNVLVNYDGRVIILDFGLAVEMDEGEFHNPLGEIAGTPVFMAPEQAARVTLTPAADFYSLGVMLFQALTDTLPFAPTSFGSLQQQKLIGPKRAPQDLIPSIPLDLNNLCVDLLNPDPKLRPSGDEIANRLSPDKLTIRSESVWIGREVPLGQLHQVWQQTRSGTGRVVFVAGKSGMGKSALVNRFLKQLSDSNRVVILRGRCYENETVAYRGFDSLVDAVVQYLLHLPPEKVERILPMELDALCQLFPVLSDVRAVQSTRVRHRTYSDPQEVRRRGVMGLHELLDRLARWEPVVLFIDDLQWGDEDTALIFRQLTHADRLPAALIICTFRTEDQENSRCLNLVRRVALPSSEQVLLAEQLELNIDRLSIDESTQLTTELLRYNRQSTQAIVEKIVSETDGDPLFIRAFANYFAKQLYDSSSKFQFAGSENRAPDHPLTKTLSDVLWSEICELPSDQRQAIEMLAAAGRPVPWQAIKNLVEFAQDPTTTLQTLRIKRIVRQSSEQGDIEAYHDKIRETVACQLSKDQTSQYCSRLASFLEESPIQSDAEFLGDLFRKSDQTEKAGQYYVQAGKHAAEILAFHRAANLFGQAIEHLKPSGRLERELRVHYGNALAYASRGAESAAQYLRAAELANDSERPDLLQQAALRFLISGHIDAGVQALIQALHAVHLSWPKTTLQAVIGLLTRKAWLRVRGLRSTAYRSVSNRVSPVTENDLSSDSLFAAQEQKLTSSQQRRLKVCWSAAAGLSVVDPVRGSYFLNEYLKIALSLQVPKYLLRALGAYVGHVAIGGNFSRKAVCRGLVEARRVARDESHPYFAGTLLSARGVAAHLRGQWSLSVRCCDRALVYLQDERCRDVTWEVNTARTFALWALQYQGNLAEIARRQPELLRIARETNDLFASLNYGTQVMTHLQLAVGRPDEARARLKEDQSRLSSHGFFVQHHNYLLANVFVDLYEGIGDEAIERLRGEWRNYQKSFLSQVQQIRIDFLQVHCRAALAAAASNYQKKNSLRTVKQTIEKLKRERIGYAVALAEAFQASWLHQQGDANASRLHLEKAIVLLSKAQMFLYCNACRHVLVHRFDEKAPASAIQTLATWETLGVLKQPERIANALLPGFDSR